jgi:hypothetical protein
MTRVAIMQPYFFPYLGYLQLMCSCDLFVILDDVQYMKGGWINRNRILVGGQPGWLTFPVEKDSIQLQINERSYAAGEGPRSTILAQLDNAYRKAPHHGSVMPLVEAVMAFEDTNVAGFNTNLLRTLHERLDLGCTLLVSSQLDKDPALTGQERVIDMCRRLGATQYINAIGGMALYDRESFGRHDIDLKFVRGWLAPYPQLGAPFVPGLSIIDVMMFNAPSELPALLDDYELV